MSIILFLHQLVRSGKKTFLQMALLGAATAFFCMSVNLYQNSTENLRQAEETYTTIAVMELYGDVDRKGQLTNAESADYKGYLNVSVKGYDLSGITTASGVEKHDLRIRYGAYIPGEVALERNMIEGGAAGKSYGMMNGTELIRFKTYGQEEYHLPFDNGEGFYEGPPIRLEILDHASAYKSYRYTLFDFHYMLWDLEDAARYADEIRCFNRCDVTNELILYPDTEYLMVINDGTQWIPTEEDPNVYTCLFDDNGSLNITFDDYGAAEYYAGYSVTGSTFTDSTGGFETHQTAPFWRWEDVQKDPALKAYFDAVWEAVEYNQCAFTVTAVSDVGGVPAFHQGDAYLQSGRMITEEEYANGSRVCLVNKDIAQRQGWDVGDRLEMHLFEYDGFYNDFGTEFNAPPIYYQKTEGFFDQGSYEIVGIFDTREAVGSSETNESTLAIPWNSIFLPKASIQNAPSETDAPVHGSLMTLWLENQSVNDFLNDMDALGIQTDREGAYTAKFTVYDQGYSAIQHSLQSMHSTARLLLGLSAALLLVTCLLLSWFVAQGHRHNAGILRMLGGSKQKVLICILLCGLLIATISSLLGAVTGHGLTIRAEDTILTRTAVDSADDNEFSAFLVTAEQEAILSTGAVLLRTAAAGTAAGLLFLGLLLLFVILYLGEEPRALLPSGRQ